MTAVTETTSPAAAVLAWARLCGLLVASQWKTTVRVSPSSATDFAPTGRWRLAIGDAEVAVVLADERLLRAISHAVQSAMSLPLGAGLLTDVEQGLIDFASVKVLHALAPHAPPTMPAITAIDFDAVEKTETETAMLFTVAVGGIAGLLRAELPSSAAVTAPAFVVDDDGEAKSEVRVVIAAVPLSDGEWQHLEAGDAVTLATSALLDRDIELHTSTAWRVARGRVVVDSPTLLTVECSDTTAAPLDTSGDVAIVLMNAIARLAMDAGLSVGQRIDFARSAADITIQRGNETWQGELVRIDGELAVRLLGRIEGGPA